MSDSAERKVHVLMLGPDRKAHSGISAIVNNYYDAGLDKIVDLDYIGTMAGGNKADKLKTAVRAYRIFKKKLPFCDVVHVNMSSDMSYYRKSFFIKKAKKAGKKIIIHQHGGNVQKFYKDDLGERGKKRFEKICSMADVFLVLNPELYSFFSGIVDAPEKLRLFPNTIKIPEPPKGGRHWGQKKLLFLGRICKEKGIRELLSAVTSLKEKYPDLTLTLGGVFEDPELSDEAKRHPDYIFCPGWVTGKKKEELLWESDIFVLPSYFEGMPVSVLEAMSCGLAVAATRVGGIPEAVTDGEDGLLFAPGDEKALTDSLERLLGDERLCEALGRNAMEKARKDYSVDKTIEELTGIYRTLAGDKDMPAGETEAKTP